MDNTYLKLDSNMILERNGYIAYNSNAANHRYSYKNSNNEIVKFTAEPKDVFYEDSIEKCQDRISDRVSEYYLDSEDDLEKSKGDFRIEENYEREFDLSDYKNEQEQIENLCEYFIMLDESKARKLINLAVGERLTFWII